MYCFDIVLPHYWGIPELVTNRGLISYNLALKLLEIYPSGLLALTVILESS